MFLVSHQQLIRYATQFEENCPHIAFPKKFLWKCTLTIALFFFFMFLLAFPILAGAIVFLVIYSGYYIGIFFSLLRTLKVSCWKYSVFLAFLAGLMFVAAQVMRAGIDLIVR